MFSLPSDVDVKKLLEQVHPAVEALKHRWTVALDAYDGEGGFIGGGYLWRFPREVDAEFKHRQTQARYHNYAATLVDYYVRKVMGGEITRETTSEPLRAFWANVDGAGTNINEWLKAALAKALAAGHVGILADKTTDAPTGPAVADEKAAVYLTRYLPTAILDWRETRDATLTAVKLAEDVPQGDLLAEPAADDQSRLVLLWDTDEWVRVSPGEHGSSVERQSHTLGMVPLVVLRPFHHARWAFVGRTLLEPSVLVALYNRASEQDEVLRNQSFSVFVVGLPGTGEVDVEKAKQALGNEVGSLRALFTYGSGSYETPSQEIPRVLEEHQAFLIRELYRMAHLPFDQDTRQVESGEAIRLKHEALSGVLAGVSQELERVELAIARAFFAWTSPTPETALAAYEAAQVSVKYPRDYFDADPELEMKTLVAAVDAVDSPTFDKYVQKQIVSKFSGGLDAATLETIKQEIDAAEAPAPVTDAAGLRAGAEARLAQAMAAQDEPEAAA